MNSRSLTAFWATLLAFSAGTAAAVSAAPRTGCDQKSALGVERVVEIDSARGPRLGGVQYKDIDFLEPGEVVLTFDDGPSSQTTPAVLEALSEHCTKATFFMVGRMAVAYPDLVRRVAAEGHTVASHTWSHQNLAQLSSSNSEREFELGMSAITVALGKPIAPFFRFPYLSDPKRMISHVQERNQAVMSIDVDSYDWRARSRSIMHNNVLSQLAKQGKGIILFHDIQRVTSSSLKALLDELKERKFKVVHLVPKSPAVTVAAYDDMAGKMMAKREIAAAAKPLATRSVVWPMGIEPSATVTAPPKKAIAAAAPDSVATEPSNASRPIAVRDNLDRPQSSSRSATARPALRSRPRPEEPSWQDQMLDRMRGIN